MSRLESYLETIKPGLPRNRVRATLTKTVNTDDGLTTEAEIVERFVGGGTARLSFASMTGKKRDGMRLPKKPDWSIWGGDRGVGISRTAALYANYLLGNTYDFEEIESRVKAGYEKEIRDSNHGRYR
ncbi:MAG: hypothetical protein Q7R30_23890 [Acidobacteriota bacterium]|nr:hypothetical protein [Acidobacteriota bacterium]